MKGYRFKDNPDEEKFYDEFMELFGDANGQTQLSSIVYGWKDDRQQTPNKWIDDNDMPQYENLIQWLGSPVGQGFLRDCGFTKQG